MPKAPLSAGAYGDDVSLLHSSLLQQGVQVPESEVNRRFFGPGTRQALQAVQTANKLPPTGVLDAATAAAISAQGTSSKGTPAPSSAPSPTLKGSSPAAQSPPAAQRSGPPEDSSTPSQAAAVTTFVVQGHIYSDDGLPLSQVQVVAVDQDLRAQQILGRPGVKNYTDENGWYEVHYDSTQFARAEKGAADLIVMVVAANGSVMGSSGTPMFQAPPSAVVDVIVPRAAGGLPSEYERLLSTLEGLLSNVVIPGNANTTTIDRLADLQPPDVTFLNGETGVPLDRLQALVSSAVLEKQATSKATPIPAAAFYGLARQGVSLDLSGLLSVTMDQMRDALTSSLAANIVPASLGNSIQKLAQSIHQFAVASLLTTPPPSGGSSIGDLLNLSGIEATRQTTLLSLAIQNTGAPEQFWQQLRAEPDFAAPGLVDKIQLTAQLGALTQSHAPLVQELLAMQITSVKDLVKLDTDAWTALLAKPAGGGTVGVPPGVPGASPAEQALNYASGLVASVRGAFATETMAYFASLSPRSRIQGAVGQFFKNAPDFDIRTSRVDAYVANNAESVFRGIDSADQPAVTSEIKRLQRVFNLSAGPDSAAALLTTPLDSAHAIARLPLATFIGQFGFALGGGDVAGEIYRRAQYINGRSLLVYSTVNEALNGIQADVMAADVAQVQQSVVKLIPNYEELFGSPDMCQCQDCRSILSPAAYLVDLFQFLRFSWPNDNGKSPLDILFSRRPDLPWLPLTCENTNTAMPYIDLVNEVLEAYIVLAPGSKWSTYAGYDTGDTPSAVLDSSAQDTNDAAYTILDQAVYPTNLPFNLPVETARGYLANLGSSRFEILDQFQKQITPLSVRGTNAEYLGLSREEYQIVAKADFDPGVALVSPGVETFYGYPTPPPANWETDLCKVPNFLERTGIAYTDLAQIVRTHFVNPSYPAGDALNTFLLIPISFATLTGLVASKFASPDPAVVTAVTNALGSWTALVDWSNANYDALTKLVVLDGPGDGCVLDTIAIVHLDGTTLTDGELDRIHRFLRLWRKTGWSIADLDRAIVALGAADITPDLLVQLLQVQKLQNTLLPRTMQILFSLWSVIPFTGDDTLYADLFLSKATQDPAFLPLPSGVVLPSTTTETLDGHIPALLAALRVRASDLDAIRADAGLGSSALLTLENVSAVYRYAALGQLLKLRIPDLLALKALSGGNPFANPAATLGFQQLAAAVAQSSFKIQMLTWLYRHLSPAPLNYSPSVAEIRALAQTLRKGLAGIAQDNVMQADPTGEASRTKLMVVYDETVVETTIGMINGSAIYSSPLAALPAGIVFPDLIKQKTAFDAANQVLRFQGAMTTAEQSALAGAAPASETAYQNAVADLYQQPVTFIQDALSGFLDVVKATSALVRTTPSLDQGLNSVLLDGAGNVTSDPAKAVTTAIASKFEYLLSQLLPVLIAQQSQALVKQTLASSLQLDSMVSQALLQSILISVSDPKQFAIADLLALSTGGLTVDYFASNNLTGAATRPATPVNFSTSIPAGTGSARWTGILQPANNGGYTFYLQTDSATPGLWLDEVALPLTQDPQTKEWGSIAQALVAGQPYEIRMEAPGLPASGATAVLRWKSAVIPKAVVPDGIFYAAAQLDNLLLVLTRLQKAAKIVNGFFLTAPEIEYLSAHGADFAGFDLNALPISRDAGSEAAIDAAAPNLFASWQRLNAYATLRNAVPQGDTTLIDVFAAGDMTTAIANLLAASGWDADTVTALAGASGYNLAAADFKNEIALQRLANAMSIIQRLGVSAAQLLTWADLSATFADLQTKIAPDIKKTVQGKYDPDSWLVIAKSLNDPLRSKQRDALVAYLLPLLGLTSVNQLLEFILIDAAMGSCMETSRIKQAISSTQFFVQRCLLNLESELDAATGKQVGVPPWAIDEEQWKSWRSRYSTLWAPAREVFTYPENWLFTELRDDKSPFFQQFEAALLQDEVTTQNVEAAYLEYLRSLDQVARLEIIGSYWESVDPSTGEVINTLHVFGRTRQDPKVYFYRRLTNSVWSAWEKVTADIQGDHLIPVVWNRRLWLFWPTFTKMALAPIPPDQVDPTQPIGTPSSESYLQIGLAWSVYKDGKWSQKSVTDSVHSLSGPDDSDYQVPNRYAHYFFVFRTGVLYEAGFPSDLLIHLFTAAGHVGSYMGSFTVSGCAGDTVSVTSSAPVNGLAKQSPLPTGSNFDAMTYVEYPWHQGLSMVGQASNAPILFLNRTATPYRILYPHQGGLYRLQMPFFYQDGLLPTSSGTIGDSPRAYMATPKVTWWYETLRVPNLLDLSVFANLTSSVTTPALSTAVSDFRLARPSAALRRPLFTADITFSGQAATAIAPTTVTPATAIAPATVTAPAPAQQGALPGIGTLATGARDNWTVIAGVTKQTWSPIPIYIGWIVSTTDLTFDNHYHPYVCDFMKALTRQGVDGLLSESTQTLGIPYTHAPWSLAFWQTGPSTWMTSIVETVTGPLSLTAPWAPTGSMIQGDFGIGVMNFEAVVLQGSNLLHYWKDNSVFGFSKPWQLATVAGSPDIVTTKATGPGCLIQSDYLGLGHGRFDVVVQEGSQLVHYSRDNTSATPGWNLDPNVISSSVTGPGCLIQSYRAVAGHGRFEVLALEGTNLVHYWQDSSHPVWQKEGVITGNARSAGCMITSDYFDSTSNTYLEVVVCQGTTAEPPYDLVHYRFNGASWSTDPYVNPAAASNAGIVTHNATGAGWMIQSDIFDGSHQNFEVLVPEGNNLLHYWLDNANPSLPWQQGQVVTPRATGPACFIQSTFGREGMYRGNFEVAALEGNRLVHYFLSNQDRFYFSEQYRPNENNVSDPYPVEDVDFRYTGAYSIYNWEIFFHAPLLIAEKLCTNQRYDEALTWIKYILNVTIDSLNEAPPGRYWRFTPFKHVTQESVISMMTRLDAGDPDLLAQVADWVNHPFEPFRIARLRPSAFMKNVLMKFWDICIGCGDYLFSQNTIESINLAEQFYVLVADSQGDRPLALPARGVAAPENYLKLKDKLDAFSNAMVQVENAFPFSGGLPSDPTADSGGLLGMSDTLYFCIPQNAKLLSYWDTVADRLSKIRNCMNIQGVRQQLPLFEPILDPALLVEAAAQGVDVGSVLSDLNSPLPYYRFSYILQKGLDMTSECRALGSALLSALEKSDAEALSVLRATQETQVQGLMKQLKQWQYDAATADVTALQTSRDSAVARYVAYQTLITGTAPGAPAAGASIPLLSVPTQPIVTTDSSSLLKEEQSALDSSHSARDWKVRASTMETLASLSHYIPQFHAHVDFWGLGIEIQFGGQHVGPALSAIARYQQNLSDQDSYDASHADAMARFFRRQQDWVIQSNAAAGEIMHIDKQIAAANVRSAVAYYDLNSLYPAQRQNAQAVQDFLTGKQTNQALYSWVISDVSSTYFQCYKLAYDLGKQAERTYRFERGVVDSNFIQFGYWDSLHKGLQSGERLYLALKQMERAYQDQNKRDYEIVKYVSLELLDPLALISLKETGQCMVNLPELFFDMDYPGHYMRRIKTVSLTISAVTGPYTSVNCTLTLLKSKIRFDSNPQPSYPEQDQDPRFIYNFAATQSIATSTAQSDAGLFEVQFRDERYLPFEGAGLISQWRLEMPKENNAFDFESVVHVGLKFFYTSRFGGDPLRQAARKSPDLPDDEPVRMFSLKHEFAAVWYQFLRPVDSADGHSVTLNLMIERFPYAYRGKLIAIDKVEVFLIFRDVYDRSAFKLDPQTPSPLGDYAKGTSLNLRLTPPGGTEVDAAIKCDSLFGGAPHGVFDLSGQPGDLGAWLLHVSDADVLALPASLRTTVTSSGTTHQRLVPALISDLIVVCHYSF